LPLFVVDDIQFQPGWVRADVKEVAEWHARIMQLDEWIVDGWGSWDLMDTRFARADRILFFDYPLDEHLRIARLREEESRLGTCAYEPPGCRYADIGELMEETLRRVDRELLPELRKRFVTMPKKVTTIRALGEIKAALAVFERMR
jgi:hypothetical protein